MLFTPSDNPLVTLSTFIDLLTSCSPTIHYTRFHKSRQSWHCVLTHGPDLCYKIRQTFVRVKLYFAIREMGTEEYATMATEDEKKESPPRFTEPTFHHHEAGSNLIFWLAVFASQAVGLTCIGLVIYWCHLYGGFSWNNDANQQFFWHPFLMVLGLIFLYGDSIIIYRAFSFLPKWILKIMHSAIHICAIVASSVGLAAVILNHQRTGKANFYSLHSWVGIGTFGFFCLQYISGFITFLYPGIKPSLRAKALPFHTFFGIGLFVMAVGTAQMGLTEKLLWTGNYTNGFHPTEGVVGNVLGLLLIIFTFLIVFIVTHEGFKRKPLPSEMPQTSLN